MSEIKITRMTPAQALSMAREDRTHRYDRILGGNFQEKPMDSFQLKDGRYAYKAYDEENGCEYYQVFEGLSEEVTAELDEFDHRWMLDERYKAENESFASINGCQYEETVDEDVSSPFSRKAYNDWYDREMAADIDEETAIDPAKEIIRMFVAALSPDERRLFELCFDSSMSTTEIREELNIPTKQALSNRKARLLEKFRKVYREAGYDVPTAKELREMNKAAKEAE